MKPILDSQEVVRRFNENEAVWRWYLQKRGLRLIMVRRVRFSRKFLIIPTGSKRNGNVVRDCMLGRPIP
jgi:hypothetical protein